MTVLLGDSHPDTLSFRSLVGETSVKALVNAQPHRAAGMLVRPRVMVHEIRACVEHALVVHGRRVIGEQLNQAVGPFVATAGVTMY